MKKVQPKLILQLKIAMQGVRTYLGLKRAVRSGKFKFDMGSGDGLSRRDREQFPMSTIAVPVPAIGELTHTLQRRFDLLALTRIQGNGANTQHS